MHLFRKKKESALDLLKQAYRADRNEFTIDVNKAPRVMAGLESFNDDEREAFGRFSSNLRGKLEEILLPNKGPIKSSMESLSGDVTMLPVDEIAVEDDITPEGFEAATIIAAASANPDEYHENAGVVKEISGKGTVSPVSYVGSNGTLGHTTDSMEYFDKEKIKDFIPSSIYFNAKASKQAPMIEMFYKTMVITAQNAGLEVLISRPIVVKDFLRHLNNSESEFGYRNLFDATIEHTILDSDSVKLVPLYLAPGEPESTAHHFVDPAIVPAYEVTVNGEPMMTAPLKIGAVNDLVALCQPPVLRRQGTPDYTDSIDSALGIDKLYLYLGTTDKSVIALSIKELPRSRFLKSPEGDSQEVVLTFVNDAISLTGLTKDWTGADAAALAFLAGAGNEDKIVRLKVTVNAVANLGTGRVDVSSANVEVEGVYTNTVDNYQERLSDVEAKPIITALGDLSIEGYDPDGTRSNKNLHTRGLLVDTKAVTEKFQILLGQPLSHLAPQGNAAADPTINVESLISACRLRITGDGLTKLLNYFDTLKALIPNTNRLYRVAEIEGLARHFIRPYYEEKEIDLLQVVNSLTSHDRAKDVSACIVNEIRRWTYRAIKLSGFAGAVEQLGGGRIRVLIGTDREIINHMQIVGDPRLLGLGVDFEVQSIDDRRMHDTIILGLTRDGGNTDTVLDPLRFGDHIWVPEFMSEANVDRQGRTSRELTVQTRNRHINNVPVLGKFKIKNLGPATTEYKKLIVETTSAGDAGAGGDTGGGDTGGGGVGP